MSLRDKLQSGWHYVFGYVFGFYYLGYEQGQERMRARKERKVRKDGND